MMNTEQPMIEYVSTRRETFQILHDDFFDLTDDLKSSEKLLYIALKKYASKNNQCFPSIKLLAKNTGDSESTVKRNIKSLEEKGYLKKTNRYNKDGGKTSNMYTLFDVYDVYSQKKSLAPTDQSKQQVNDNSDMQEISTSKNISCDDNNTISHKKQVVKRVNKPKKDQVDKKIMDQARAIVENKLNDKEIISLLKATNNDLERIKNYYELSKTQNVKVLVKWLVAAIKKGFDLTPVTQDQAAPAQPVKNLYNSFPQRNYTKSFYDNLESRLLGV